MTHVPFTSRLASLVGFPSNPSPKYDGSDEYYIPYTGTYEPPPHGASTPPVGPSSSSTHTHAHTQSGSTKVSNTQASSYSGHPYNPDRFLAPVQKTTTPVGATTGPYTLTYSGEESDRGRRPLNPRRISTSSSFAALALSSEHHGTGTSSAFPKPSTSTVQPNPNTRRGGPSYLALDGGFIGQSPMAVVPPREGKEREGAGRSEKIDKAAYRSSFASFMTFGNSRKSTASASASGSSQVVGTWPHSATGATFPHGASKLRGELRPNTADNGYYEREEDGESGGEDMFARLPPIPPYMRQRSQSYVEQTEQGQEAWRRKSEEERRMRQLQEELHSHPRGAGLVGRNSVKVHMPTSFFDVSPIEEREGANPFGAQKLWSNSSHATSSTAPHPYHRHYQPAIVEPPYDTHGPAIDLNSPTTPSFDFLHPYATAPTSTNTSPSKSSKSRPSHLGIRPLIIPRRPVPDFHERDQESDRGREHLTRVPTNPFPFVNPFSFARPAYTASQPPTRPVTPKGRLKSLVSLGEGFRTLKGSISTPNLRSSPGTKVQGQPSNAGGTQLGHSTQRDMATTALAAENSRRPSSSRTIPPNAVLQGQTLCDTFFLPRPRFHAHQISPPDSPHSPVLIREPTARHRKPSKPQTSDGVIPAQREWNRRAMTAATAAMTRSDPGAEQLERERQEMQKLGRKKASAPDLRRKPEKPQRPVALKDMRRLTEAEKVLLKGEEQDREREEWQRAAKGSFQNTRSRSLSRTRTKSIAKASTSAATSGDEKERERERPSRKNTIAGPSSVAITVTITTAPGTAPPTATSSSGAATSGDESKFNARDRDAQRSGVKHSMEYLASKAFSQGHTSVAPAPGSSFSGHTHSRHQSGDTGRDSHHRDKSKNQSLSHRRSESWGRTALKRARNSCADPDATSPAIERIIQPEIDGPAQAVVVAAKASHDDTILDIGRNKLDDRPPSDDLHWRPSAIGIAIGTPPLDALLNDASNRIEHPYSSPIQSPIFVGPHPASPIISPPSLPHMNDVVSRHRFPPRPNTALSPPRSLDAGLDGLDAYVPTMEASSQTMFSRESWLVYMNALEEGEERPRTMDKGKGRAIELEPVIYEERPSRDVPEDVDVTMDTPELQLDLGLDGSPAKSMKSRIISAQDMEAQLTKAFRRQSAASMSGSSENEHAALTFEAGTTLSRLLSSRSVTSIPRSGSIKRTLSNPGTPKVKKTVTVVDPEDPQSTLTQTTTARPPIPIFEPTAHHRSSSGGASKRISGHSDAPVAAEGLWRKSMVSSEFGVHSPPSQESSPKASPRTLVNLDDLEGYSDLFYASGHGSFNGRPKSGGSNKTNVSSGLMERALRPEVVTFSNGSSSAAERSHSASDFVRGVAGQSWSSGRLSPPPVNATFKVPLVDSAEPSWRTSGPTKLTGAELERTWDPEEEEEEEEEDSYRIGDTRQPIIVRPTLPIHRHSTKLSVIEGSVDEHATASESTADPEDQEGLPATSLTRAIMPRAPGDHASVHAPLVLDTLDIPVGGTRRTSSERTVVPDAYARISMMTNTSGQSRMSGLSDFPVPPIESAALALTPSDLVQAYFPPRASSLDQPTSPASVLSVEPPSPIAEPDEGEDQSVAEHHHAFSSLAMTSTPVREYRSNRATFGPDAEIVRQWAEREHSSTPTTEEH